MERKTVPGPSTSANEDVGSKSKQKSRSRKRKRLSSSSESDDGHNLPENMLETERNVHASAVRNNLDDISVRKILKKVVANDHVLALVKLREEEEEDSSSEDKPVQPKLTRAKAKELKNVSSPSAPWNLGNLELTPINHIPVKTRPEVTALFAQELAEDEDDEEYEPTHEEGMSDDEHEQSCSDVDSQPRTPATPKCTPSPKRATLQKDGPFKVPQDVNTARRKLVIDEDTANIALRTRSKLSLSTTSIEHIESEFVPPDDIPPQVDGLWNQFLNECFSASGTHEEDDEADPEYNAAADADALEEDEEALGRSLIKISKKELSDLVTELLSVMPASADEDLALDNLANTVLTDTTQIETPRWEGKVEILSDEEAPIRPSQRLAFEERDNSTRFSIGKNEPQDDVEEEARAKGNVNPTVKAEKRMESGNDGVVENSLPSVQTQVYMCIEERTGDSTQTSVNVPATLRDKLEQEQPHTEVIHIELNTVAVTEQQVMILQQQLRQHIQLAATNYLQLYVHPVYYTAAPQYKEYLEALDTLSEGNPNSVVKVCNLQPAIELVQAWTSSVSKEIPENFEMIQFVHDQLDKSRRRYHGNNIYAGDFPVKFKKAVANSSVFLYPYMLPAMPYRAEDARRNHYLKSEDDLIVLGLDQFWEYIEANPRLFPRPRNNRRTRWGLTTALKLVSKHMVPWQTPKSLKDHVAKVRSRKDKDSPIYNYFKYNEITPVKHSILPFNPALTLIEQPEHEMPRIWVRYLAQSSVRFKNYLNRKRHMTGEAPRGVPVESVTRQGALKKALPLDFTKEIPCGRLNVNNTSHDPESAFKTVETSKGARPLPLDTMTVFSTKTVTTPMVMLGLTIDGTAQTIIPPQVKRLMLTNIPTEYEHCTCCILLRKMFKTQTVITDFFKPKKKRCYCSDLKYPKISNKLKLLLNNFKNNDALVFDELEKRIQNVKEKKIEEGYSLDELVSVTSFQLKLVARSIMSTASYLKIKIRNMFVNFDATCHDPIQLANDLFKACDIEMVDVYMDFLGFLTIEQVDKLCQFKQYFTRNCVKGLMDKIEEQVQNPEARKRILIQLMRVFNDSGLSSCAMCSSLLEVMAGYWKLAEYTFSLFPHIRKARSAEYVANIHQTHENPTESYVEATEAGSMNVEDTVNDEESLGEAKKLSNQTGEMAPILKTDSDITMDIGEYQINIQFTGVGKQNIIKDSQILNEDSQADNEDSQSEDEESLVVNEDGHKDNEGKEIDNKDSQDSKDRYEEKRNGYAQNENSQTDIEDSYVTNENRQKRNEDEYQINIVNGNEDDEKKVDEKPVATYIIKLEEIKSEPPDDWKRVEDKLILEILEEKLTVKQRKNNGQVNDDFLEEINVYKLINGALPHKTMDEVRNRVQYILSLIVQNGSDSDDSIES